jgi:hypothetical protein
MMMALKKAVKTEAKLRMAIVGPAGSGKTFTALKLATGLAGGKPIALFDTEHGSAAKYADDFDFDVDNIAAPFHPNKFCDAIHAAVQGGYGVVIIDSLSHAWNGPGGLLNLVEDFTVRTKNSFTAWKDATPIQDKLIQAIVSADIHIIVTMRSKTDYVMQEKNGKQTPSKVGMAPIQRDGMDYEFDVVMQMDAQNNTGMITKTRCSALNEGIFPKPGKEIADILIGWLSGNPAPAVQAQPAPVALLFESSEQAIDWGFDKGCFNIRAHAVNAYEKLKAEKKPTKSVDMFRLWVQDVERRVAEQPVATGK